MSRGFKCLLLILCSHLASGQVADSTKWSSFNALYENPLVTNSKGRILTLNADWNVSTRRISNQFLAPFLFGKDLGNEIRNKAIDRSGSKFVARAAMADIRYVDLSKSLVPKKEVYWYLMAGRSSILRASVTEDAFRFIFEGNTTQERYKFYNCTYQKFENNKLGGGLFIRNVKSKRPYNLSIGVYLMQTTSFGHVRTGNGDYYLGNEDSFQLNTNYRADFSQSGSNGYGVGGEIAFNARINPVSAWGFNMSNFGYTRYRNGITRYSSNGTFRFSGVFIPEVGRLNDPDYFKNQFDSITEPVSNKRENQSSVYIFLPEFRIYYLKKVNNYYLQFSIMHPAAVSGINVEFRYFTFINKSLIWGASFGTMGNNYLNTDIRYAINKRWYAEAGIHHLEALILPAYLGGAGGFAGIRMTL